MDFVEVTGQSLHLCGGENMANGAEGNFSSRHLTKRWSNLIIVTDCMTW